jgi:hypothetical protein
MPAPTLRVFVDFDSDTAFEINPLILGSATEGILDTNTLGSGTLPVEITDLVTRVAIRRGRNRQGNDELSTVTLKCVDGFKLLAGSGIATVTGSGVQTSGARVNAILDEIEWPLSLRNVDTGDSTLQADPRHR